MTSRAASSCGDLQLAPSSLLSRTMHWIPLATSTYGAWVQSGSQPLLKHKSMHGGSGGWVGIADIFREGCPHMSNADLTLGQSNLRGTDSNSLLRLYDLAYEIVTKSASQQERTKADKATR